MDTLPLRSYVKYAYLGVSQLVYQHQCFYCTTKQACIPCFMFCSRLRRGQPVCDRIAADCLATAASRCAVASCVLRRQMFRSLKQCVKQSCPPQEEQQGDMLLFINSNAFSPHRRGRAALFLSLREEVELNSLRYM